LIAQARSAFAAAMRPPSWKTRRRVFLGKAGVLTSAQGVAQLDPDRKRTEGARLNAAKEAIEQLLAQRRAQLAEAELDAQLALTRSSHSPDGSRSRAFHPVIRTWMRVEQIFRSIGSTGRRPEIETDW